MIAHMYEHESRRPGGDSPGAAPLFAPDRILPRMVGETALLFGGGRALLLQLAHPLVAAGVADHSQFQAAPLARLERTLDMMLALVLGDRATGRTMLRTFHAVHVPIHGALPVAAGPFPAGTAYTAHDPALKLWVGATLIDTTLLCYERFVRPLTPQEKIEFYDDSVLFARRLGIPAALMPPTLDAFHAYMAAMFASDTLTVTDAAWRLAWEVLEPVTVPPLPRIGAALLGFVAAGLLPPRLRAAYSLEWSPARQRVLDTWSAASRRVLPLTPRALRLMPQAGGSGLVAWMIAQARTPPAAARR